MAPPDQAGSGASSSPPAAAALRRQTSCTCTCSGYEPPPPQKHERRRLSSAASFSSPSASPAPSSSASTSTDSSYHPAPSSSHKSTSTCESIPFSASTSSSSYESFLHIDPDCLDFDDEPSPSPAATRAAAAYDPKRLPSAMFRTRSTNPAEWSVSSNDSLFSIQLSSCSSSSGAGSARYGDVIYYDAGSSGSFPRFPSSMVGMVREPSSVSSSGGLCLREDCARCNGAGGSTVRKSVRFAAATDQCAASAGLPPTANATAAAATENTTPETAAAGWCQFACCWPSLPTLWWPRGCGWNCHCCGGCWC